MESLQRIKTALLALAAVTIFGTVGYLLLGFTPLEALYQTVTTVATVGFREVRPLSPAGQLFTIVLIVLGVGTVPTTSVSSSRRSPKATSVSTWRGVAWTRTSQP